LEGGCSRKRHLKAREERAEMKGKYIS